MAGLTKPLGQAHVDRIYSPHGFHQVLLSELDLHCSFRLQHATSEKETQ